MYCHSCSVITKRFIHKSVIRKLIKIIFIKGANFLYRFECIAIDIELLLNKFMICMRNAPLPGEFNRNTVNHLRTSFWFYDSWSCCDLAANNVLFGRSRKLDDSHICCLDKEQSVRNLNTFSLLDKQKRNKSRQRWVGFYHELTDLPNSFETMKCSKWPNYRMKIGMASRRFKNQNEISV